jgi:hypothetical protein
VLLQCRRVLKGVIQDDGVPDAAGNTNRNTLLLNNRVQHRKDCLPMLLPSYVLETMRQPCLQATWYRCWRSK